MLRLSLVAAAVLSACAPGEPVSSDASRLSGSCEPLGGEASGVAFTAEQATAAIDMVDNASAAELEAVPGIGPAIAERLIAARPLRGHDDPLAALDAVPYVGARLLGSLRDNAFASWCALDDGRQSCCVELSCSAAASSPVEMTDEAAYALLDWANRASPDELAAVCRIGESIAASITAARPIRSVNELLAVRNIGETTLRYLIGADGYTCASQGAVVDAWCGLADASCTCEGQPTETGYVLDEDAATGWAEEAAGEFYSDNGDFVWEEYCEAAYDHNLGYDQIDVINFCDRYVPEKLFIATIEAALGLAGTVYADEQAAIDAIDELAEATFFANVDDWMAGFEAALIDFLG